MQIYIANSKRFVSVLRIGLAALALAMWVSISAPTPVKAQSDEKSKFEPVRGLKSSLKQDLLASGAASRERMPERAVLIDHLQSLELAQRAYTETKQPETYVFGSNLERRDFDMLRLWDVSGQQNPTGGLRDQFIRAQYKKFGWQPVYFWKILDIADQAAVKGSCQSGTDGIIRNLDADAWRGFKAVTYVNNRTRRVVVAIAGTDMLGADDWINDAKALVGVTAPYFEVACAYMRHVVETYEKKFKNYRFECAGHSLGGGACSFAANRLGRRGVTLNPIGTSAELRGKLVGMTNLPEARASEGVFNYVDPDDPAHAVYKAANRVKSGAVYWIKPAEQKEPRSVLDRVGDFLKPRKNIFQRAWARYQAHSANVSLDRLVANEGLARIR